MRLVIVHYHLRPGGIRRVIELAVPHLVRKAPRPITRLVLATGEAADPAWRERFARQLPGLSVEFIVEPAFNYLSEQSAAPAPIATEIRRALEKLFPGPNDDSLVWAHNLGVGRNLILARELGAACALRGVPLVSHHHDWWFDNRWMRWPEMRAAGFRTLAAAASAVFPTAGRIIHAAINHADAAVLARHLRNATVWLPNLAEPATPPAAARVLAARRWLKGRLAQPSGPVWLLPCRTLRRKNIAEALLLKRWLRPGAWLVVTGGPSSAEEAPYFRALDRAASRHHWRLRLGVLGGNEARKPSVSELLAASEAVLLTSVQEGFGLPYLEAAAAQRPLITRRLANIAPDLHQFGFRFPQAYDEILVSPVLFDWKAERSRQADLLCRWQRTMPVAVRERVSLPPVLAAATPCPVAFSRLTLSAQIEVLTRPVRESWAACAPLNPFLQEWCDRAATGRLRVTPWPRSAERWLGGKAYAHRFFAALRAPVSGSAPASADVQAEFIRRKLGGQNLYPLLWNIRT